MKTFWKRFTSSVILLALFAFILIGPEPYAGYVFDVFAVVFSLISVFEFGNILLKSGHSFDIKGTAFFTALMTGCQAVMPGSKMTLIIVLVYVIHAWTRFLVSGNQEHKMRSIFASAAAFFMFSVPFSILVKVYQSGTDQYHFLFLYLLLVTKIGDIAAYVVGSLSNYFMRNHGGNHKMIPSISPGKSYEGAAGGLVFTLLLSWLLWPLCGIESMLSPFWTSMLFGIFLYFGCMGGDLSESAFKRTCKIKDSGAVLPGIGGVLDLVDSLLVNAPLFLLLLLAFTNIF